MKRLRTVGLAAAVVAGFAVATLSGSTASTGGEAALLREAWDVQKTASLYNRWRAQNQGEAEKLDAYWATGGAAPTLATAYGRSWVLVGQAYWSLTAPPPTTTTSPPSTPTPTPTPSPTPSPTLPVASPIGTHNAASPGYWPPTHLAQYGYVSTEGPAPAAFVGLNLVYRSAITCSGYTNLSEATCVNNGWALRDASGNVMRSQYGVLADPGNTGYQAAWAAASLQRITAQQEDGYWADDFTPSVQTLATCGCWPANRPSMDAYKQALLSFAAYMNTYFGTRGLTDSYNTGVALDNDGSLTAAWWGQLGPHVDYLTIEGWLTPNGILRRSGATAWYLRWDEFRALHRVSQQAGAGFLPMDYPAGGQSQAYVLGTFLLDWDGTAKDGFAVWNPGTVDAWISYYDQAIALGRPVAATVDNGSVHTRKFERGTLTVDSAAGTTSIVP